MLLVFIFGFGFGAGLALEAALGASLGLDAVAPDLIASPISLGALGAGAATSSSSSSSSEESLLIEGFPTTLAVVVLALFLFLSWPISSFSDSIVNFIVSSGTACSHTNTSRVPSTPGVMHRSSRRRRPDQQRDTQDSQRALLQTRKPHTPGRDPVRECGGYGLP